MLHHYFLLMKISVTYMPIIVSDKIKTVYLIGYLAWRVIAGLHKHITLSFMRVGHTRCMVDGNFGLIKRVYRHGDIDAMLQL